MSHARDPVRSLGDSSLGVKLGGSLVHGDCVEDKGKLEIKVPWESRESYDLTSELVSSARSRGLSGSNLGVNLGGSPVHGQTHGIATIGWSFKR